MNYNELINKAIEKNEVIQLLRGEGEYEVEVSRFTSDVFPTDINAVLVNCFYKQKENFIDIEGILYEAIKKLLEGTASDVYIAVLYFDACIFQEEKGTATFILEKNIIIKEMIKAISAQKNILQNEIVFCNGMNKQNAWKNIENFDKYYRKKYGFNIIL